MLRDLHSNARAQMVLGALIGVMFGFLLQKGGVTDYDVIIGQLLWEDFTVAKVMLSAIVTGMVGVHALRSLGWAELHPKSGSVGMTIIGGLIFGVGFGLLGYCPGTLAGAVGQGELDALAGGIVGVLVGAGLFAAIYHRLEGSILRVGHFGDLTLPQLLRTSRWAVVVALAALLAGLLVWMESAGL